MINGYGSSGRTNVQATTAGWSSTALVVEHAAGVLAVDGASGAGYAGSQLSGLGTGVTAGWDCGRAARPPS
jgi:hypothetical protein